MPDIGHLWIVWLGVAFVAAPLIGAGMRKVAAGYRDPADDLDDVMFNRDGSLRRPASMQPAPVYVPAGADPYTDQTLASYRSAAVEVDDDA